jgi:hypothetical protein
MSNKVGALEGNITNFMKQIEERIGALESNVSLI